MKWMDMDCKKVQRRFDDLAEGRLSEAVSRQLRRHLEECTDCRVQQQRTARLQQLLAIKRSERPAPEYFNDFLGEFHQRLQAEAATQPAWWQRWATSVSAEPTRTWRYAFAGALTVFVAFGAITSRVILSASHPAGGDASQMASVSSEPLFASAPLPASHSMPTMAVASVSPRPAEPSLAGGQVIIPAVAHDDVDEAGAPRYVLEKITDTPARYEVASIHF